MKDHPDKVNKDVSLEKAISESSLTEELHEHRAGPIPVSPLGWSIKGRLCAVAAALALLWLAVAWALGWLA